VACDTDTAMTEVCRPGRFHRSILADRSEADGQDWVEFSFARPPTLQGLGSCKRLPRSSLPTLSDRSCTHRGCLGSTVSCTRNAASREYSMAYRSSESLFALCTAKARTPVASVLLHNTFCRTMGGTARCACAYQPAAVANSRSCEHAPRWGPPAPLPGALVLDWQAWPWLQR
jgi:hypothetical protein